MNPSTQAPTVGRVVLVKFLNTAGIQQSLRTLPGIVRVGDRLTPGTAPLVQVTIFGDGASFPAVYAYPAAVPLFDATNPDDASGAAPVTVPEHPTFITGGPFVGRPVWCEWMPYQVKKAAAQPELTT